MLNMGGCGPGQLCLAPRTDAPAQAGKTSDPKRPTMRRFSIPVVLIVLTLGSATADAGLWTNIYRGLDYAATPLGFPITTTSNGTRINGARSGRLYIAPSGVGGGYELQFQRNFGPDATGRLETLRLGALGEVTLNGQIAATAGYNNSYLNDGEFKAARASLTVNDLAYNVRTKLGAQDAIIAGNLQVAGNIEINALGFYDLGLNISNTDSELRVDGIAVRDSTDLNFDAGPIVISGNIFVDGAMALLNSLGVDTSAVEDLFPQSPIDRINDAITTQLQEAQVAQTAPLLLSTVLSQDEAAAQELVETLAVDLPEAATAELDAPTPAWSVPEPGTLLLIALGGATFLRRRTR